MRQTTHAAERMAERFDPEDRERVAAAMATLRPEQYRGRAVAVRVARLSRPYGDPWADGSNGSDVWAVIRGDTVATVMLRRKSQPTNPAAFNVARVILSA